MTKREKKSGICRVGNHFYAFQVTVGKKHTCNPEHVTKLARHLLQHQDNKLTLIYVTPRRGQAVLANPIALTPANPAAQLDKDLTGRVSIVWTDVARPDERHRPQKRRVDGSPAEPAAKRQRR